MGDARTKSPSDPLRIFLAHQLGGSKGRRITLTLSYSMSNSKQGSLFVRVGMRVIGATQRRGDGAGFSARSVEADFRSWPRPRHVRVPIVLSIHARRCRS
jgi:hypothetical protein